PSHTYSLSLHDALPISRIASRLHVLQVEAPVARREELAALAAHRHAAFRVREGGDVPGVAAPHEPPGHRADLPSAEVEQHAAARSEEHTSELQSRENLV